MDIKPRYLENVPFDLAVKLKEAGYPQDNCDIGYDKYGGFTSYEWKDYACPCYVEVIDWLICKGLSVEVKCMRPYGGNEQAWCGTVYTISRARCEFNNNDVQDFDEWTDACETAIEFALTCL